MLNLEEREKRYEMFVEVDHVGPHNMRSLYAIVDIVDHFICTSAIVRLFLD